MKPLVIFNSYVTNAMISHIFCNWLIFSRSTYLNHVPYLHKAKDILNQFELNRQSIDNH